MSRDKVISIMAVVIVFLIAVVVVQTNSAASKDAEIELLKEKLSTSESVNQGLKDSVEKLIRYQECTAKILITPRDQAKAIEGSINDPAAALEQCRIGINGTIVSENPSPASSNTPSTNNNSSSTTPQPTPARNNPTTSPTPSNPPNNQTPAPSNPPPAEPEPLIPIFNNPVLPCVIGLCLL